MNIEIKRTVIDGRGVHKVGSVVDFNDKEAKRLIKLGAAELSENSELTDANPEENSELTDANPDSSNNPDSDSEFYTDKEIADFSEALCKIDGIDDDIAPLLVDAEFCTINEVAEAIPEELSKVKGIGKKSAIKIIASAKGLI